MPKHKNRILVVNCNCDRPGGTPAYYPAKKYEFAFPEDSMHNGIAASAKTHYIADVTIAPAHQSKVKQTFSTYHK